jgi:hypothetical protein
LPGLSDGFAVLQQWDLAEKAAAQACVVCSLLGRIDKRASMHASRGHIARNANQPVQIVADHWWSAIRDYQALDETRKAAELLLQLGEMYMKVAITTKDFVMGVGNVNPGTHMRARTLIGDRTQRSSRFRLPSPGRTAHLRRTTRSQKQRN